MDEEQFREIVKRLAIVIAVALIVAVAVWLVTPNGDAKPESDIRYIEPGKRTEGLQEIYWVIPSCVRWDNDGTTDVAWGSGDEFYTVNLKGHHDILPGRLYKIVGQWDNNGRFRVISLREV